MVIPIKVEKIITKSNRLYSNSPQTNYLLTIEERDSKWNRTYRCTKDELIKFRREIDELIETTSIGETLNLTEDQERVVEGYLKTDPLCQNCSLRLTEHCKSCIFLMQSPLERKLFVGLSKTHVPFLPQYPIDWKGQRSNSLDNKLPNAPVNFKNILTISDFFVHRGEKKLCIYADGHSYHERTEEQASRDKNIDRKLQEFGYRVMRFTGKEINDNIDAVVGDIKAWYNNANL